MPTDVHLCKQVFEGLLTYSKVKKINRGYITRYAIKLTLRDQNYSYMIIEGIKIILILTIKYTYSSYSRYVWSHI